MKRILLAFLIFLTIQVFGKEVTIDQAKEVATSFLQNSNVTTLKSTSSISLTSVGDILSRNFQSTGNLKSATNPPQEIYIFNINQGGGFIIVSGDDAAIPILGYSSTISIDPKKLPTNFVKWIENYKQQILYIKSNKVESTAEIQNLWNGVSNRVKAAKNSVVPLLSTEWNQSPYVNARCPYDNDYDELTVTGCPATAMAQIMKFWKYPAKGQGFHSYQHSKYGTLSANFGSTYYNWDAMPNNINSANEAVATLMYQLGVAVEMNYNVAAEGGSGSYVIIDPWNRYPETQSCEYAFKTYFGYSSSIDGLLRENFTDTQWKNKLKTELDAGRPVQYAGFGQGGHTFVCDGYDDNDFFHMNWGWGGYYDGYFLLDALNPGSGGIGSGAGTYNEGQQAIVGIKPPDAAQSFTMEIYDDVVTDKSTIAYGEGFVITTDILNDGTTTFNGDYCAAVFDLNDVFVDYVEIKTGYSLNSGFHYTSGITFSTSGLLSMLPGSYKIYVFYRTTGGNWVSMKADPGDALTSDFTEIKVNNENDITLYSEIELESTTIYANEALSVMLDVANFSATNFSGTFDVSLYDLEGDWVFTVEEKAGMSLPTDSHYTNGLTFTTDNVDVEPGTYLLALLHKRTGSDWEITGSTDTYFNPIKVIVQGEKFEKDMYEDNDSIEKSFSLNSSFTGNLAEIGTPGSNIHVGSDWDFYTINLDPNYIYSLDARLHDAFDSEDGNIYSVDALFLYSISHGDYWSDAFDDVMPGPVTFSGRSKLHFIVSPYFLGETGTYLLDINLTKVGFTSNPEISENKSFSVFPNPCFNSLDISNTEEIIQYKLMDINGRALKSETVNQLEYKIDLSSFESGIYILEVETAMSIYTEKIIKK